MCLSPPPCSASPSSPNRVWLLACQVVSAAKTLVQLASMPHTARALLCHIDLKPMWLAIARHGATAVRQRAAVVFVRLVELVGAAS